VILLPNEHDRWVELHPHRQQTLLHRQVTASAFNLHLTLNHHLGRLRKVK
jgi:hypothetical protein